MARAAVAAGPGAAGPAGGAARRDIPDLRVPGVPGRRGVRVARRHAVRRAGGPVAGGDADVRCPAAGTGSVADAGPGRGPGGHAGGVPGRVGALRPGAGRAGGAVLAGVPDERRMMADPVVTGTAGRVDPAGRPPAAPVAIGALAR